MNRIFKILHEYSHAYLYFRPPSRHRQSSPKLSPLKSLTCRNIKSIDIDWRLPHLPRTIVCQVGCTLYSVQGEMGKLGWKVVACADI